MGTVAFSFEEEGGRWDGIYFCLILFKCYGWIQGLADARQVHYDPVVLQP